MRLLSAHIQGFKSFAKRTHVVFGPGITGIVGPNGSGKSNISEAIRWVLGEQSTKALRAKERTDVIYSGTAAQADRAIVTLTFDNESGRFPLQDAEIAITRVLRRNGESRYAVNGEDVRLVDLQHMLAQAGIGTRSYTVISQGTVDQYLTATPQGRRELFNEATGIKALQINLAQSNQKLTKTRAHADEVRAILAELAPKVTFLKRQLDKYERRDLYQQELQDKQRRFYAATWHASQSALAHAHELLTGLEAQIANARKMRDKAQQAVMSSAQGQPQETKTLTDELREVEQEYERKMQRYNQTRQQKQMLEKSLQEIHLAKMKAEQELAAIRSSITISDWNSTARELLRTSSSYFELMLHGSTPNHSDIQTTHTSIQKLLEESASTLPSDVSDALKAVERPLQEVARLSAIAQERRQQHASLQETPLPSRYAIDVLREQIAKLPKQSAPSSYQTLLGALEKAREQEISLEREGSAAQIARDQATRELTEIEQEILRECGTQVLEEISHGAYMDMPAPTIESLRTLHDKIAAIGERDELIVREYEEAKDRADHLTSQLQDIEATLQDIEQFIQQVSQEMNETFHRQFEQIAVSFRSFFIELFGGGDAKLTSTDEGIDITIIPPRKRARHISLLSGGERALTSLALLLAVLDAQEPPFIVLDEVDAALDEANSKRFAQLLRSRAHATQSIVISHNRETMAAADALYGVTMHAEGISTLYSVKLEDLASIHPESTEIHA